MATQDLLTCNPDTLTKLFPCGHCLDSNQQKWAVIVMLLSAIVNQGNPSSADTLAAEAACWKCYSDAQMLDILINILGAYAVDNDYVLSGDISTIAACLECTDIRMLHAIALKLFCSFVEGRIVVL